MEPQEQSAEARAEIKVKLIENGVLIKLGPGWLAFPTWPEASAHIAARIEKLKRERDGSPKGGC